MNLAKEEKKDLALRWGFTKRKKNTEACGQKQYCCQRGCKYNVDEDWQSCRRWLKTLE